MYRLPTTITVLLTVLFSTAALAFDKEPVKIDVSDVYLSYSYVIITTFGSALGVARVINEADPLKPCHVKRKTHFMLRGVGFVVKGGYIVTAAHVVRPLEVKTTGGYNFYTVYKPIKVLNKHIVAAPDTEIVNLTSGIPVEVYHLDIENDLAILKYDKDAYDLFKPVPFEMVYTMSRDRGGSYDLIQPGDAISTIVRKRDEDEEWEWTFEVRNAKVMSGGVHESVPKKHVVEYTINDFSTDIYVYPGDSGSPAIVFEGGKPVIVGVIRSTRVEGPFRDRPDVPLTAVARIDSIKLILEAE